MIKLLVIADLDGSLVDISTRAASAGPEPSRANKERYSDWVSLVTRDLASLPVNLNVLNAVQAMYRGGAEIIYLTSREESHRASSQTWLNKYGAPPGDLVMRGYNDWRSTADMKGGALKLILENRQGHCVVAVDDDASNEMTEVYLQLGISHLRVMDNLGFWGVADDKAV